MLVGFAEGLGAAKTYARAIATRSTPTGSCWPRRCQCRGRPLRRDGRQRRRSKTAVNVSAGARTQVSGLLAAALTVLTLLLLTGLFEELPDATLAAIVIAAVVELVDFRALIALYRAYTERLGVQFGLAARPDFIAAVAALLGVTVFDTLPGLFIGIGVR